MPYPTFTAPARFDARCSLLGRCWLRSTGDRQRAEGYYLISAVLLAAAYLVAGGLLWSLAERGAMTALAVFGVQAACGALLFAGAFLGWRAPVRAACEGRRLVVRQGRREREVPYAEVTAAACVPAGRFHRHEARYAATDLYLGRVHETILVVRLRGGSVVALGLPPGEQLGLLRHMETQMAHATTP
jgi:hypothetical protein